MKEQFEKLLSALGLSARQFAIKLDVPQPTIAQIMLGRNNPSLQLLQKILTTYPQVDADWLLMGTGKMFREITEKPAVYHTVETVVAPETTAATTTELPFEKPAKFIQPIESIITEPITNTMTSEPNKLNAPDDSDIERIIIFHKDRTAAIYTIK